MKIKILANCNLKKNDSRVFVQVIRLIELPLTGVDCKGKICSELYCEDG